VNKYNSTIKVKVGQCVDCTNGIDKQLIKERCQFHYNMHRRKSWKTQSKKQTPIKQTPLKRNQKPIKRVSKKGQKMIQQDEKFYQLCWDTMQHACEECDMQLKEQNGRFTWLKCWFSHIIVKKGNLDIRHILENINILCLTCHQQWETGQRESMKINKPNQIRIEIIYNARRNEEFMIEDHRIVLISDSSKHPIAI